MNILAKEIDWLMWSMVLFYIVPGAIAGILYLFPTKRDLAARRHLDRVQTRFLTATS